MTAQLRLAVEPAWPFADLQPAHYGLILADPPWAFRLFSDKGDRKSPQAHYTCLSLADIKALPVAMLAASDCALLMWATWAMLPDAIATMAAWGFTYKTGLPWAKQSSTGRSWAFGTGYVLRNASEPLLFGTRGRPKVLSRGVRGLIVAPVREHSRKPDDAHLIAEKLYAGPRCELFARQRRPGWDVWGNETEKFEEAVCG
ncbi:MT-A70 family methyltransferase [Sandarakinorhabdus sp.]|uniref:MT-A70 family methyltransferase n=1 Tax=Sandarakinorhabdus sp. TaxID=1916663 RepID=UPI00286DB9D3|nr:MT-A70 family methyltransferase [Sandarakinorhabdus sp.]